MNAKQHKEMIEYADKKSDEAVSGMENLNFSEKSVIESDAWMKAASEWKAVNGIKEFVYAVKKA